MLLPSVGAGGDCSDGCCAMEEGAPMVLSDLEDASSCPMVDLRCDGMLPLLFAGEDEEDDGCGAEERYRGVVPREMG